MKIDVNELRKEINKLHSEMGFVNKEEVKKIIDELEKEAKEEHDRLMEHPPIHSHGGWD
jgi:polyhydroxyalkanoate synthesis regulator phasin